MSLYYYYQQFWVHAIDIYEEIIIKKETNSDLDGDWDHDEVDEADVVVIDYFSSDKEDGATKHHDPNRQRVESVDNATNNNAWIWKLVNP